MSVVKIFWASFYVGNLWIGNENFNPRDGILGALMVLSMNFAHWCLSEECEYTFSIFMKLGESIFSALVESGKLLCCGNCWYQLLKTQVLSWKRSCRGGRVTKRQMFFVSDEADRYFVSSPWSEALRLLLGKIFWNRVLDVIKRCAEFWQNQVWRRFADSEIFWIRICWQNL